MTRLLRPHVPVETRCRVALRQLGEMWPDTIVEAVKKRLFHPTDLRRFHSFGHLLRAKLRELASLLGCEVADLRLDHDPALGARRKVFRRGEHVGYDPPANSVEHLIYRTKADHLRKTNLRGDGAQHPDRVLIKRNRRLEERGAPRSLLGPKKRKINRGKRKWPSRPLRAGKRAWPRRPLRA